MECAGTVALVTGGASGLGRATAQVTSGTDETILVLPSGLRIENGAASVASYRITLPATVEQVNLRVGDAQPRLLRIEPSPDDWSETIPLRP